LLLPSEGVALICGAVPDDEFETMKARARSYRKRLAELGSVSGPVIDSYVHDRLRQRPTPALPPAQAELGDEILSFLNDPRLTTYQAEWLELEFFGRV
jgi:hypothetical protein